MLTVRLTFRSPGSVPLGIQRAVLCEAAQLSPPVLLAPSHLVAQLGAAQVVLVWQEPEGGESLDAWMPFSYFFPPGFLIFCKKNTLKVLILSKKTFKHPTF